MNLVDLLFWISVVAGMFVFVMVEFTRHMRLKEIEREHKLDWKFPLSRNAYSYSVTSTTISTASPMSQGLYDPLLASKDAQCDHCGDSKDSTDTVFLNFTKNKWICEPCFMASYGLAQIPANRFADTFDHCSDRCLMCRSNTCESAADYKFTSVFKCLRNKVIGQYCICTKCAHSQNSAFFNWIKS